MSLWWSRSSSLGKRFGTGSLVPSSYQSYRLLESDECGKPVLVCVLPPNLLWVFPFLSLTPGVPGTRPESYGPTGTYQSSWYSLEPFIIPTIRFHTFESPHPERHSQNKQEKIPTKRYPNIRETLRTHCIVPSKTTNETEGLRIYLNNCIR